MLLLPLPWKVELLVLDVTMRRGKGQLPERRGLVEQLMGTGRERERERERGREREGEK